MNLLGVFCIDLLIVPGDWITNYSSMGLVVFVYHVIFCCTCFSLLLLLIVHPVSFRSIFRVIDLNNPDIFRCSCTSLYALLLLLLAEHLCRKMVKNGLYSSLADLFL